MQRKIDWTAVGLIGGWFLYVAVLTAAAACCW